MNKQNTIATSVELNYRKNFKCVGSECALTCCAGWNVHIDKNTYYRYKSDPEIIQHISKLKGQQTGRTSQTFAQIDLKANGDCPMLDENMLCKVQSRLGEEALSKTCTTFPRQDAKTNGVTIKGLTLGCPEVARLAIFSNQKVSIESAADADLQNGTIGCAKALIDYLQNSERATWEKLMIIASVIKASDQTSRNSYFTMLELLKYMDENLKIGESEDCAIFQVQSLYPLIDTIKLDGQRISLNDIKQNGRLYIDANGQDLGNRVKQFVIARELLGKAKFTHENKWLERLLANEIFKKQGVLAQDNETVLDLIADMTLTLAIVRFFVIINFGFSEFRMPQQEFTKVIALLYRKLGHNASQIKVLKQQLEKLYIDYRATGSLLLA